MNDAQLTLDKVFVPLDMRVRVRLSAGIVQELGWDSHKEDFTCPALVRGPEDLLLVPPFLKAKHRGEHPLVRVMEKIKQLQAAEPADIAGIPTLDEMALKYRYWEFDANWVSPKNAQLDIVIGAEFVRRLSQGSPPDEPRAFYVVQGGMLALASERRGEQTYSVHPKHVV